MYVNTVSIAGQSLNIIITCWNVVFSWYSMQHQLSPEGMDALYSLINQITDLLKLL